MLGLLSKTAIEKLFVAGEDKQEPSHFGCADTVSRPANWQRAATFMMASVGGNEVVGAVFDLTVEVCLLNGCFCVPWYATN
jgi:hypothetical protein